MKSPLFFGARDIDQMSGAFVDWQMDLVQQEAGCFHGELYLYSQLEGRINFYSARTNKRVFANGHHKKGSVLFNFVDCQTRCKFNGEEIRPFKIYTTDSGRGQDVDAGSGFVSHSVSIDQTLLENWLISEGIPPPLTWNFVIDYYKTKRLPLAQNFKWVISRAIQNGEFDLMEFKLALFDVLQPEGYQNMKFIAVNYVPIHEIVEMIHEAVRCGRDVNLQDILELYGGPMRTFYYNFNKYTGFTPHKYIKNLRLSMAQKLLKRGEPTAMEVRNIAYQLGFSHLGQFAKDYRKLFGEVPSATLKGSPPR